MEQILEQLENDQKLEKINQKVPTIEIRFPDGRKIIDAKDKVSLFIHVYVMLNHTNKQKS
jgi:hypothetical protein